VTAATLPALLEEQAARRPRAVAIRRKQLGIWRELTWREYAAAVREVALGLDDAGVAAGDRVGIYADNGPDWLFADLGIQAVGAASVALYPSLDPAAAAAILDAAGAAVVVCGDQEQVDALASERERLPALRTIVVVDTRGLHTPEYGGLPLETLDALRERGRAVERSRPSRFGELLAARRGDEVAVVALTAGTEEGRPRAVLLSQAGEVAMARLAAERVELRPADRSFSLLPLPHATGRLFDAYAPLVAGSSVCFAESGETTAADIGEAGTTVLVGTPRMFERFKDSVELRIEHARPFKRAVSRWALRTLARAEEARGRGGGAAGGLGALLARWLVGRFVVEKAGLGRVRYGGVACAAVSPLLVRWFWALGVPLRVQYGQVEAGGLVAAQRGRADAGTAGPPAREDVEVRVDADGELLVRSPGLLVGRLDGEPAPLEDGWLRTGDLARLDEQGRVAPLGRRAELLVTASGAELVPAAIEATLKLSPYVAGAMIVAAGRPFVSALVELREDAAAEWARAQGIAVTTYESIVANDRVRELLAAEVEKANEALPPDQRVQAFRLFPQPLRDELGPTGAVKRSVVEARYRGLIEELYAEAAPAPQAAGRA